MFNLKYFFYGLLSVMFLLLISSQVDAGITGGLNYVTQNRTYFYDNTAPGITISTPSSGQIFTTQTPTFNANFSDKSAITCKYWIIRNATNIAEVNPTAFVCNAGSNSSITSPALTDNFNYTLHINATDEKKKNEKIKNFRVATVVIPPTPPSGGGPSGGGSTVTTTIIIGGVATGFNLTSDSGDKYYDFIMNRGSKRIQSVLITNTGATELKGFELSCVGNYCDWVSLTETKFDIKPKQTKNVQFIVSMPSDAIRSAKYDFQIRGDYKTNNLYDTLNVYVTENWIGFLFKDLVWKPIEDERALTSPVFIVFIGCLLLFFVILMIITSKMKDKTKAIIISSVGSLALSSLIVVLL